MSFIEEEETKAMSMQPNHAAKSKLRVARTHGCGLKKQGGKYADRWTPTGSSVVQL